MTLAHGTDQLESDRLVLRRVGRSDLPFFARIHGLPEVARYLWPGGRAHSCEQTASWMRNTLASYERLALGYLAVVRKEDDALIGRCGLMELVIESAAPEHGLRKESSATPSIRPCGARVLPLKRRVAFATMRATFCGCPTRSRLFIRRTSAHSGSPNAPARGSMGKWK